MPEDNMLNKSTDVADLTEVTFKRDTRYRDVLYKKSSQLRIAPEEKQYLKGMIECADCDCGCKVC